MTQATATEKTAQSREGFEVDGSFPSLTHIYIYISIRVSDPFQDGNPAAKALEVWSFMHCVPS